MSKIWLENDYPQTLICGIDEAGRGPLAGPCVVCGVVLPCAYTHPLINDSKVLSATKRAQCFKDIIRDALSIYIISIPETVIDEKNIYRAVQLAMFKIANEVNAQLIFTDAMPLNHLNKPIFSFIKGDSRSINIAAASIIAKEVRDRLMEFYDLKYPLYGFAKHKGYPTKAHLFALEAYGPCPIHRKSYGPVTKMYQNVIF